MMFLDLKIFPSDTQKNIYKEGILVDFIQINIFRCCQTIQIAVEFVLRKKKPSSDMQMGGSSDMSVPRCH